MANEAVNVFTRRGSDRTTRFRKVADDAWHIAAGSAIIDGEIVVPTADGTTDFSSFKTSLKGKSTKIVLVAFDLLYLNGYDLRKLPLIERKTHLKKIIDGSDVHFRQSFEVDGKEMFAHACKVGLETLRKYPALTKPRRAVHLQRWRTWVDLSQLAASLAMAPKFASVFAMSAGITCRVLTILQRPNVSATYRFGLKHILRQHP